MAGAVRVVRSWVEWPTGVILIGIVLASLLAVTVVNSVQRANAAEQARIDTACSAQRRIDMLSARIDAEAADNAKLAQEVGSNGAKIDALRQQVIQQGGVPIVEAPVTSTTTPASAAPVRPGQPPSPTTTSSSTTSTTRPSGATTSTSPGVTLPKLLRASATKPKPCR